VKVAVFDEIRVAAQSVASLASWVSIDLERLSALVLQFEAAAQRANHANSDQPTIDPAHLQFERDDTTLAYVITLDAINFGSGWFPVLDKRPNASGYFTIARGLREAFERRGPWSAKELLHIDAAQCTEVFGQDPVNAEAQQLMALFATSLADLGRLLDSRFGGSFAALIDSAQQEAEGLVQLLIEMPSYRDVAKYGALTVPFYKRAQITVADLAMAFGEQGPGQFRGLDQLTLFADNLVPHVLRCEGVLNYRAALLESINRGDLLEPGSEAEVEIRAVAVHAVELMTEALHDRGISIRASDLDHYLWNRGQRPEIKAHPRHRCRTLYY
jgi:hypothetical protein